MELIMMWTAKRHRDPSQMISATDMVLIDVSGRPAQNAPSPTFGLAGHLPVVMEE
jgi:hypothetical protein